MGILGDLLQKLHRMVVDTAPRTVGLVKYPTSVTVDSLIMSTGRALKCPGCNTLTQLEGFDPIQMAEGLVEMGMAHLPNCVLGGRK